MSPTLHKSRTRPRLEAVDDCLQSELQRLTDADPDYWSSPDRERREAVHALFQYPAMMVPIVQRRLIDAVKELQPEIRSVYDPFVGAGTALVAGMYHGLDCYGQDLNPLALLVTRVKTGPCFLRGFRDAAARVLELAQGTHDEPGYLEKWFTPDVASGLGKLQAAIRSIPHRDARRFLWVTLAETTRLTSNDRTSTYKLHARTEEEILRRRPDPVRTFKALVEDNLDDLREHCDILQSAGRLKKGVYTGVVRTELGDSSVSAMRAIDQKQFDLVVTSPPYGDNITTITYGQHSYLPLQWIDLRDVDARVDRSILRTTQELDRRSLGGTLVKLQNPGVINLIRRSPSLQETIHLLAGEPPDRARRVAGFFLDLDRALARIASAVRRNGYMIWTIGNRCVGGVEIPNDKVISELFEAYGVKRVVSVGRTIHAKRMAPRNGFAPTMKSEEIVIFRQQRSIAR